MQCNRTGQLKEKAFQAVTFHRHMVFKICSTNETATTSGDVPAVLCVDLIGHPLEGRQLL